MDLTNSVNATPDNGLLAASPQGKGQSLAIVICRALEAVNAAKSSEVFFLMSKGAQFKIKKELANLRLEEEVK